MTSVSYVAHDIKSLDLADAGRRKIEWADRQMPVLAAIRARFEQERRWTACASRRAST